MAENTILFPVYRRFHPYGMSNQWFWLPRYLPAKLHLVDVLVPTGWIRWLLSAFSKEDRKWRLQMLKHQIFEEDHVPCEIQTLTAPNLTIGIVEAAWRIKPNFVILMPALQDALGKAGLRDLKTRLGEMGRCKIVLLRHEYVRLESCNTGDAAEAGRVIHAKFG